MSINCDLAESEWAWDNGLDPKIISLVDQVNVCCAEHAGSIALMEKTVALSLKMGKSIGAHPSYPDRKNFGRLSIKMSAKDLELSIKTQVNRLKEILISHGGNLAYIKPHGALYHDCLKNKEVLEIVAKVAGELPIMLMHPIQYVNILVEGFLDRTYFSANTLVPRKDNGALIEDVDTAYQQYCNIKNNRKVNTIDGSSIPLDVQTLCVHSDSAIALPLLQKINSLEGL